MNKKSKIEEFEDKFYLSTSSEEIEQQIDFEQSLNSLVENFFSEWSTCEEDVNVNQNELILKEAINPSINKNCEFIKEVVKTSNAQDEEDEIQDSSETISKSKKPKSIHQNHRKRVRDKFLKYGLETFTDVEVLELLLFFSIPQKDTNEIAHKLLNEFGTLKAVLNAEYYDLIEVAGISEVSASLITLHREIEKYVNTKEYKSVRLSRSYTAGEFCCDYFKSHVEESFILIFLDDKDFIQNLVVISNGVENETAFYPRRVLKEILRHRTNKIMLSHNHPGDNAEPSGNDVLATTKLLFSLDELGIMLKDHIVCAGDNYVSMADRGHLDAKPNIF